MKVWLVIEGSDGTTVGAFDTEALAEEWVKRENAAAGARHSWMGDHYAVEECAVHDALPEKLGELQLLRAGR